MATSASQLLLRLARKTQSMCHPWHWAILPWEMCLAKHSGCPWHCSPTPVNATQQAVHHMHIQQVQDVAFVQRRVSAMPVCLPVAMVIFPLLLIEIN